MPVRGDLIGRNAELEAASAFLDDLREGPSGLLITGEAGIGKTALWKAIVHLAGERGVRVLQSRPTASEASWSFSGLADLLGDVIEETRLALTPPQRAAIDAALLLEVVEEAPNPLAVSLALRGSLEILAEATPVLVAVDDVQWLDRPSTEALLSAIRRLETAAVGVLLAGRGPDSLPVASELERTLGMDRVRRMALDPLSREELQDLVRSRTSSTAIRSVISELHRVSRGNPLYALQIARVIAERDLEVQPGRSLPIPEDLTSLIRQDLQALPRAVGEALLVVAACSDPTTDLIQQAVPGSDVGSLVASAGVLEAEGKRLRFTHPLLAAVLQEMASPQALREAHLRLAGVVVDPEERARHLALSSSGPDGDVALVLDSAARSARSRGAPSAAAELSEMACHLTPPTDGEAADGRRIRAAEYHLDAGDLARAGMLLEDVVSRTGPGTLRARACQRLGWVRYHADGWTTAAKLFDQAMKESGDDPVLRASIELDGALSRLLAGDLSEAASAARRALEEARRLGDVALQTRAKAMLGSLDFLMGKGIPEDLMTGAIADETWTRPGPTLEHPSVAFGVVLKLADDLEGARERLTYAHNQMKEMGNERSLPFLLFHLAELECWSGNLQAAERYASEAGAVAMRTGQEASRAFTLYAESLVDALRGRVDRARARAEEGIQVAERSGAVPAIPLLTSVLGFLWLSEGDPTAANRYFGPLADDALTVGVYEPGALRYLGDAVETLIAVDEVGRAEQLLDELEERAASLDRRWALAVALRGRGLLAAARGDLDEAQTALEEALALHGKLTYPFEAARTELILGTVHRRARRKRAGRDAIERALGTFQQLGTPLWAEKAQAELGRIGGRAKGTLELTPTEGRIAELVAKGATNQEVARALFLAPKTVEWNLSRIFRKLGLRSRTELARWLGSGPEGKP
jgi:DNA-binding CsgD family transcriptional regulator